MLEGCQGRARRSETATEVREIPGMKHGRGGRVGIQEPFRCDAIFCRNIWSFPSLEVDMLYLRLSPSHSTFTSPPFRVVYLTILSVRPCRAVDVVAMIIRHALPRLHAPFRPYASLSSYRRAFSTTELSNGVTLAYDLHEPSKDGKTQENEDAPPILFIHGLFGSKKNNRSMSKYALISSMPPLRKVHGLTSPRQSLCS